MKKIGFTLLIGFIFSLSFANDDFEDWKKIQNSKYIKNSKVDRKEYKSYRENMKKEFEEYQKIVDEEYRKYKQEILKKWSKAEISNRKKWVEYSDDIRVKKVVDFEKGYIKVEALVDEDEKNVDEILEKAVNEILIADKKEAIKKDRLENNIKKSIEKASNISELKKEKLKSEVKNEAIVADIFLNEEDSKKIEEGKKNREVEKKIEEIVKKSIKKAVSSERKAKEKGKKIVSKKIMLPSNYIQKKAEKVKKYVEKYSKEYKIEKELIYAIIHSESSFNPMAKSHIPAYGLMQIVPKSAGLDVSKMIYGKEKVMSSSFLYNSENNVMSGTAYLNILNYRYLKKIKDPVSRKYCVISAYNTGAGNVIKAFMGKRTSMSKAAEKINNMSPQEVYLKLEKDLPYDETKKYLKKVSARLEMYKYFNNGGE